MNEAKGRETRHAHDGGENDQTGWEESQRTSLEMEETSNHIERGHLVPAAQILRLIRTVGLKSNCVQPFPQDRWPCDHLHVDPVESLPHPHMLDSPHLEVISCSVRCRISNDSSKTKIIDETYVGLFRSQHVAPV